MRKIFVIKLFMLSLLFLVSGLTVADELIDGYELEYQVEEKIILLGEEKIVINEYFPSEPKVGPTGDKVAFISPAIWETIGQVYLYDVVEKEDRVLLEREELPAQSTPKSIKWLNEQYLLLIIGNAYGTVSVGGDLYLLDIEDEILKELSSLTDNQEYKSIKLKDDQVVLKLATFDEEYIEYQVEERSYEIDQLKEIIDQK